MLWQDLRYALRTMRRNRAFTAVAGATSRDRPAAADARRDPNWSRVKFKLAGAGLTVGVPLAIWSRKFAASLITGLPATNVFTIVTGAAALTAVALAAAYLPARHASRVDPMVALRHE